MTSIVSSTSSLFTGGQSNCSTAESSTRINTLLVQQANQAPRLPSLKASLIHIPLHLPSPPEPFEEVKERLILDDDLEGAPLGFVVHKLRSLGPSLLKATTSTCLYIPPGPELPQYLRCTLPPLSSNDSASVFRPSHILAIRSNDSPRTLLLPIHGLLFAAVSPPLAVLSSRPEKQPPHCSLPNTPRPAIDEQSIAEDKADLPIIDLNIPSSTAFPLLQGWIYLRSASILLSSLLPESPTPSPAKTAPSSLSHLLNPTDSPSTPRTSEALAVSLANLSSSVLIKHVRLVHSLWTDVVCLQIGDEELWRTMGLAWKILVAALALRERQRKNTEAGTA